jgi:hypothetical protein
MMDVSLEWGADFDVDANGDLLLVDGDDEVRQRLERRLFTAVNGYVWHPEYGAGLPQKIGSVYSVSQIKSICQQQLNLEASVATNPPPILTVTRDPNQPDLTVIGIQYWDAVTGISVSFTITA